MDGKAPHYYINLNCRNNLRLFYYLKSTPMFTENELDAIHISLMAYKNYLRRLGKERSEVNSAILKIEELIVGEIDTTDTETTANYKIWESKN